MQNTKVKIGKPIVGFVFCNLHFDLFFLNPYPHPAAAPEATGTGTSANTSSITLVAVTFRNRLSGLSTKRWLSTGPTMRFTSSGKTKLLPAHGRHRLAGAETGPASPRAAAQSHVVVQPRAMNDLQNVIAHLFVDVTSRMAFWQAMTSGWRDYRLDLVDRMPALQPLKHFPFVFEAGVPEAEPHEKAVELGFGQRKGAFVVDRVLRGDHQEGPFADRMVCPSTVTRPSPMASNRAACVRGVARLISSASTIWAKTGPGTEIELGRLLVEDRGAGDVGGQQVGRALHALERAVDTAGQRAGEHGLRHARHVLQQDVSLRRSTDTSASNNSCRLPRITFSTLPMIFLGDGTDVWRHGYPDEVRPAVFKVRPLAFTHYDLPLGRFLAPRSMQSVCAIAAGIRCQKNGKRQVPTTDRSAIFAFLPTTQISC